jgi:hypothetical protein
VRSLLWEYSLDGPDHGDFVFDSGIQDPAWKRGETEFKTMVRIKTWQAVDQELRQVVNSEVVRPPTLRSLLSDSAVEVSPAETYSEDILRARGQEDADEQCHQDHDGC